jgi:hypothetical protein
MSLNDLKKYTEIQQEAIESLGSGIREVAEHEADWTVFRDSCWGKLPKGFQRVVNEESKPNVTEGIELVPKHTVTAFPWLPTPWGALSGEEFLVRSEYDLIEQSALDNAKTPCSVFLVTGQAGIGLPCSPLLSAAT